MSTGQPCALIRQQEPDNGYWYELLRLIATLRGLGDKRNLINAEFTKLMHHKCSLARLQNFAKRRIKFKWGKLRDAINSYVIVIKWVFFKYGAQL